jgi:NADP-dependent 3-hydroxy acid dehydrogenase YdfG
MPTAVITGGSRGIGKAIALQFLTQGYNIAICAQNAQTLESVSAKWQAQFPNQQILAIPCNVAIKEQCTQFAQQVLQHFSTINVLVNNAGTYIGGQVHTEPEGALQTMLDTNLLSAYHITRALIPQFLTQKKGHIFNIASIAGLQAYPNGGSYSISKFALIGFSKNLREEMKPHGIRVTTISPGATLTDSWAQVPLPPNRLMQDTDIAQTVWYAYNLNNSTVVEDIVLRPQLGDI